MAAPGHGHFYYPYNVAALAIETIRDKARTQENHEDAVHQAWLAIPRRYFPDEPPAPVGPGPHSCYSIEAQPYRGAARPQDKKPDVVVIKFMNVVRVQGQTQFERRDVLWIECKAPKKVVPNGWHTVLQEATERLIQAHSDRQVFLILAVGLYWMPFMWDPVNFGHQGQHLQMLQDNGQPWPDENGVPDIDPRIRPIPDNVLPPHAISAQRHIINNQIHTREAYTVNHFDTTPAGVPIHLPELQLLEHIFAAIQAHVYQGPRQPY
ncbi:hypothetical protein B0T21DRAFT_385832 [Apiosordaria backusii]|uniref:Uncharacterized protein n=1 Tax=Apiosordaria backusii TaxID=314023 RepID=A0AA40B2W7_9PEZI|nr:hypothetical protein B0T21DRAFT_385832 [Apiosordaria backusii]